MTSDLLTAQAVAARLETRLLGRDCLVLSETDSTNTRIKREYFDRPTGFVLIAERQTAGRGRLGRTFVSPPGDGLYFSFLLRPDLPLSEIDCLTLAAAVAVCEAVERLCGLSPAIKWVNDVLIAGKKVCGILTEASVSMESGDAEFIVPGIGINVYAPAGGFPEELKDIAGAVFETPQSDGKNRLAAEIIRRMMDAYANMDFDRVVCAYRAHSMVLGKRVMVLPEGRSAYAEDIDEDCHLLVRYEDGQRACLSCGEIRILMEE